MVALAPLTDNQEIQKIFKESEIDYNENSGCVTAVCGGERLGYCLYDMDERSVTVRFIKPSDDIMLADGILRSTLHVAAERGITSAYYADTAQEKLFEKLDFIENRKEKTLKIEKLFESCCCKGKK